jgi:hypothetical protein
LEIRILLLLPIPIATEVPGLDLWNVINLLPSVVAGIVLALNNIPTDNTLSEVGI